MRKNNTDEIVINKDQVWRVVIESAIFLMPLLSNNPYKHKENTPNNQNTGIALL